MTVRDFEVRPLHVLVVAGMIGGILSGLLTTDLWKQPIRFWSPGIVFALAVSIAIRQFVSVSIWRVGVAMIVMLVTYFLAVLSFLLTLFLLENMLREMVTIDRRIFFIVVFAAFSVGGLIGAMLTVGSLVFLYPFKRRFRGWRPAMLGGMIGGAACMIGFELKPVLDDIQFPFLPGLFVWQAGVAAALGYGLEAFLVQENESQGLTYAA